MQGKQEGLESSWENIQIHCGRVGRRGLPEREDSMSLHAVASRWHSGFQEAQEYTGQSFHFISITGLKIKF